MVSIYFGGATTQPPAYLKKKIEEENKYANGFIEGKLGSPSRFAAGVPRT